MQKIWKSDICRVKCTHLNKIMCMAALRYYCFTLSQNEHKRVNLCQNEYWKVNIVPHKIKSNTWHFLLKWRCDFWQCLSLEFWKKVISFQNQFIFCKFTNYFLYIMALICHFTETSKFITNKNTNIYNKPTCPKPYNYKNWKINVKVVFLHSMEFYSLWFSQEKK